MKDYMSKTENNLGKFLQENSNKSNESLADSIREIKNLSNSHDNVVIFQEKRTICATAEKLQKIIKAFNKDAELTIKIKNKKWKQD